MHLEDAQVAYLLLFWMIVSGNELFNKMKASQLIKIYIARQ